MFRVAIFANVPTAWRNLHSGSPFPALLSAALGKIHVGRPSMVNTLQKFQAVRNRARWFALLCITLLAFAVPSLFAQVDQGAVTGVVTDTTGAAIPNATVSLTNTDTGFVQEQNTNASGIYIFSSVKIGNYKVSATAAGFGIATRTNLVVQIQSRV